MRPIGAFMRGDHARLETLLDAAERGSPGVDLPPFDGFREGILRHIGMEEKILLPALLKRPGAPAALAEKLRLDHAAIANLLFPAPTRGIIRALRAILSPHNRIEEDAGGFYDLCDELLADEAPALLERLRAAPAVPLRPYSTRPETLEAAKRAMRRAGFSWDDCVGS